MTIGIFKEYVQIRKEIRVHSFLYYFKKILIALLFMVFIAILQYFFSIEFNYKDIAAILVSVNSIVAAFLILSLTILLTQNIQEKVPNKDFSYKRLLVNNAEINAILILISILINLIYMLLANTSARITNHSSIYSYTLIVINYLSVFTTIFVINTAIKDLLLISKKTKNAKQEKVA